LIFGDFYEIKIAPTGICDMMAWSERSSAWLEHLLWEQDVAGSNPVAPTIFQGKPYKNQKNGLPS
jgi:hypothetical protein